jgi:hypothetical protein
MPSTAKNVNKIEDVIDDVNSGDESSPQIDQSVNETDNSDIETSSASSKKKKKDKKKKKKKDKEKSSSKKKKKDKEKSSSKKKKKDKEKSSSKKSKREVLSEAEDESDVASDVETRSTSSVSSASKPSKMNKSELLDRIRQIPEEDQTVYQKNYCNMYNVVNTLEKTIKEAKLSKHITEKEAIADYRKGLKKKERGPTKRRQTGFSQPYDVPQNLKTLLDSEEFEDYVVEATPTSGHNAYDKEADEPKITPSQLVDACRHFFIAQDGKENKGLVSFEDEETPVYSIFSEYLEALDSGKLEKSYKPSQGSQNADRGSLSRIQMISFACAYLKWANAM